MNVNFFAPVKIINGLLPRLENGHIALVASVASIIDGGTFIFIFSCIALILRELKTRDLRLPEQLTSIAQIQREEDNNLNRLPLRNKHNNVRRLQNNILKNTANPRRELCGRTASPRVCEEERSMLDWKTACFYGENYQILAYLLCRLDYD